MAFFVTFVLITSLIKLSASWFKLKELGQRLLEVQKERSEMELAALKAQVNPHFFFNTLNSIYALSLESDPRLPGTILKLSQIMRYYLYQPVNGRVPLEKEISILHDYIGLQKIRSSGNLKIIFETEGDPGQLAIAPLILLTFLENAFKHGAKGTVENPYIHIGIQIGSESFYFSIRNNIGLVDEIVKEEGGIGIENVKRRLDLIYPYGHELFINQTENEFRIDLTITL